MEFAAKSERVVGRGKTALLRRWKIARRHWPYQLYLSPTKKRIKRIHLLPRYHPPAVLYALLNEILIPPPPPLLHVKSLWIISHLFEMYKYSACQGDNLILRRLIASHLYTFFEKCEKEFSTVIPRFLRFVRWVLSSYGMYFRFRYDIFIGR